MSLLVSGHFDRIRTECPRLNFVDDDDLVTIMVYMKDLARLSPPVSKMFQVASQPPACTSALAHTLAVTGHADTTAPPTVLACRAWACSKVWQPQMVATQLMRMLTLKLRAMSYLAYLVTTMHCFRHPALKCCEAGRGTFCDSYGLCRSTVAQTFGSPRCEYNISQ